MPTLPDFSAKLYEFQDAREKLGGYFARSCHLFRHSYNTRITGKLEIINGGKRETASADTIGHYLIDEVIVPFAANFVSYSDEDSQIYCVH